MIKAKYRALVFDTAIVLLISALMGSCRRCYTCYVPLGTFLCYKGNDTSLFTADPAVVKAIIDSGSTCDTLSLYHWSGSPTNLNPGCNFGSKQQIEAFESLGDSCVVK